MSEQLAFFAPTQPSPPSAVDESVDADFEIFWKAVPKHPNSVKALSRISYRRARESGATAKEIMAGIDRYRWSPDPHWRPHVTTWLNGGRYRCEAVDLAADAYGLDEWREALPRDTGLSALSYERAAVLPVLIATGWEPTWRGDLAPLNVWLRDGYLPDSIALVVAAAVAEFGARASLMSFDKRVRYRAERFAHQVAAE